MKFGAQVNCYRTSWDEIRTVIDTMEAGRWSSLWFADHFVPSPGPRDDERVAERYVKGLGPGTVAGPRSYVIQRIGEFIDAGVTEIMFGGIPTAKSEEYQRFDEEILAEFD